MDPRKGGRVSPPDAVRAFVKRINAHDSDGLIALMAPQYAFVDSLGNRFPHAMARDRWRATVGSNTSQWYRTTGFGLIRLSARVTWSSSSARPAGRSCLQAARYGLRIVGKRLRRGGRLLATGRS